MKSRRLFLALALIPSLTTAETPPEGDALLAEVARSRANMRESASTDDMWAQVKPGAEAMLKRTEDALRDGRRLLALLRFSYARRDLDAVSYVLKRGEERKDLSRFEAEWERVGKTLRDDLRPPSAESLAGVRPAAVRAIAEAALAQARVYYDASLEYGRSTMPDSGLFYLGSALAQRDFAAFCRRLSNLQAHSQGREPGFRTLLVELEALETELLSLYRPPLSIDKHGDFIGANSALKEARELNEAGLHRGALLRYLQAVQRYAILRGAPQVTPDELAKRLAEHEARLSTADVDHSLGRLFLEAAQADVPDVKGGANPDVASAIASGVLPRYFAALEPSRPQPRMPDAQVTVTLVRWPYT